ncbi:hypothetical protein GCM10018987_12820 [Streptomyces cremeus]
MRPSDGQVPGAQARDRARRYGAARPGRGGRGFDAPGGHADRTGSPPNLRDGAARPHGQAAETRLPAAPPVRRAGSG